MGGAAGAGEGDASCGRRFIACFYQQEKKSMTMLSGQQVGDLFDPLSEAREGGRR